MSPAALSVSRLYHTFENPSSFLDPKVIPFKLLSCPANTPRRKAGMSSNDRIAGVKPDSIASTKPSNRGYQTPRLARSLHISQLPSFWQDRLTLRGRQGVYMSGQMRFEMVRGRRSQRCPGETSPSSLKSAPHASQSGRCAWKDLRCVNYFSRVMTGYAV